jgi:carbon storage regulator
MLVLTRTIGESIIIGDNITVNIVEATNCHVKLGITAPKNILVLRNELLHGSVSKRHNSQIKNVKTKKNI